MAKKTKTKAKQTNPLPWIITALIIFALCVVAFLKLGVVGLFLSNLFAYLLGDLYWMSLLIIIALIIYIFYSKRKNKFEIKIVIGVILLNLAFLILIAALEKHESVSFVALLKYIVDYAKQITSNEVVTFSSGIIGNTLYTCVFILFDRIGTFVIVTIMAIIAMLLIVPIDVYRKFLFDAGENIKQAKIERDQRKEAKKVEAENKASSFQNIELTPKELKPVEKHKSSVFIDIDTPVVNEEVKPIQTKEVIETAPVKTEEVVKNTPVSPKPAVKLEDSPKVAEALENSGDTYQLPPVSLLDKINSKSSNVNSTSAQIKGEKVIEILHNFGIEATLLNTHIGPSVTKFEIKPDSSVKISKIQAISDNIKMELAAKDIRIEAPIPGLSAVGIEIPNVESTMVRMYELMEQIPSEKKKLPLLFALGKDLMGKNIYCELDDMPHLLIAGATGSGKSVCINTIIVSFLMKNLPSDVKLVLIDPKKVEFSPYHDVPHLLWPVITDATMASNMLKKIVVIMEERYETFSEVGVRNIKNYNEYVVSHNSNLQEEEKPLEKMPYIVVIIDELADLMAIAGKDVELSIQRITQLARASGIHLIVATQRPSTDVITGIIKSNIPSRISFAVASSIDSRTILDQTGAERLLGYGDMLYAPRGENSPIRIQGVYVTDQEIKNITDFVKRQQHPVYEDSYFEFLNMNTDQNASNGPSFQKEEDGLLQEVIEYITDVQKASTSLLQRRFGIGYNRAARIIEILEDRGMVGPAQGSKPREVYLKKEDITEEE